MLSKAALRSKNKNNGLMSIGKIVDMIEGAHKSCFSGVSAAIS